MPTDLVKGSVGDIAMTSGMSLARALMAADHVILFDTSDSMNTEDSTGGLSRYAVGSDELRRVQRELPGKLVVFSFSTHYVFCPGGIPEMIGEGTNLLGVLQYAQQVDGAVKSFIVISDGYPDPGTDYKIINLASQFISRIDTIFAGPVEDTKGREFMNQLATAGHGQNSFSANASNLGDSAMKLLKGG